MSSGVRSRSRHCRSAWRWRPCCCRWPTIAARAESEFQRLVGGLGFGPAARSVRPARLLRPPAAAPRARSRHGFPPGRFFCPHHAHSAHSRLVRLGVSRDALFSLTSPGRRDAVLLHPCRTSVTIAAGVTVLRPYLVGLRLAGVCEQEAAAAVRFGADLVRAAAPVAVAGRSPGDAWRTQIGAIDGVVSVTPRIVGRRGSGQGPRPAVRRRRARRHFPRRSAAWRGGCQRWQAARVGRRHGAGRRLNLRVGSIIAPVLPQRGGANGVCGGGRHLPVRRVALAGPPDPHDAGDGGAPSSIRRAWRPTCSSTAGRATRTPSAERFARESAATATGVQPAGRGAAKTWRVLLPRACCHREGVFNLHFVLAFAVGILVVLVTSGFGLPSGAARSAS